jgi:hypothetical protein
MNSNPELHLSSNRYKCLCFTHAVQEAMNGREVHSNIDDFSDDRNTRQTWCQVCSNQNYPFED